MEEYVKIEEFKMDIDEEKVKQERIKAVVTIVVTAAVNIANLWGYAVDQNAAIVTVLTILSVVSWIWCWWKNQNVTEPAVAAQNLIDQLKLSIKGEERDDAEDE